MYLTVPGLTPWDKCKYQYINERKKPHDILMQTLMVDVICYASWVWIPGDWPHSVVWSPVDNNLN